MQSNYVGPVQAGVGGTVIPGIGLTLETCQFCGECGSTRAVNERREAGHRGPSASEGTPA